jgi:hypothetical protein
MEFAALASADNSYLDHLWVGVSLCSSTPRETVANCASRGTPCPRDSGVRCLPRRHPVRAAIRLGLRDRAVHGPHGAAGTREIAGLLPGALPLAAQPSRGLHRPARSLRLRDLNRRQAVGERAHPSSHTAVSRLRIPNWCRGGDQLVHHAHAGYPGGRRRVPNRRGILLAPRRKDPT